MNRERKIYKRIKTLRQIWHANETIQFGNFDAVALYNNEIQMHSRQMSRKKENYACTELCNCLDMKRKSKQFYFPFMNNFFLVLIGTMFTLNK